MPPARLALYAAGDEPPTITSVEIDDQLEAIETLCELTERRSAVPAPALREVIENLVHARFRDAVVSVLDAGATVRVSDHGPGIDDVERALRPGFSSATSRERAVVRGVGGGLPFAARVMAEVDGTLEIEPNLGGGVAVTLGIPASGAPVEAPACGETARMLLALLLEIGPARSDHLARELRRERAECGRELALLQHRGLVARDRDGAHVLTDSGSNLVATLF